MIGSNFSISVDSRIPRRVRTQTNQSGSKKRARTNSKHKSPYGCLTNSLWISNLKPECVEVNQLKLFVQKAQGFFAIDYVYVSKQELRRIKRDLRKNQMSFMMNLYRCMLTLFNVFK